MRIFVLTSVPALTCDKPRSSGESFFGLLFPARRSVQRRNPIGGAGGWGRVAQTRLLAGCLRALRRSYEGQGLPFGAAHLRGSAGHCAARHSVMTQSRVREFPWWSAMNAVSDGGGPVRKGWPVGGPRIPAGTHAGCWCAYRPNPCRPGMRSHVRQLFRDSSGVPGAAPKPRFLAGKFGRPTHTRGTRTPSWMPAPHTGSRFGRPLLYCFCDAADIALSNISEGFRP